MRAVDGSAVHPPHRGWSLVWSAQALLRNGRLRLDQVVGAAAAALGRPEQDARETVAAALVALVRERYVERAPPCGLPPRLRTLHTKVCP